MSLSKKHTFKKSLLDIKKNTIFHRVYYSIISYRIAYKYRRFIKYATIGLIGTAVDVILIFVLVHILQINYIVSAVFSDIARGFTNYNVHKKYAFKINTKTFSKQNIISFIKYYSINITSVVIVFGLMIFFVEICNIEFILAKLMSDLIMNVYRYFGHSKFAFTKSKSVLGKV
ncbi:GtrA family protein [archaeon]|jgi:putative flippase GtrA|nr:GtrA family protein [archaeon]MDD3084518.1 GtrA family protein [Candidatus ainarchaeum sp.]MDD4220799.1 GtrA family protein [Candidatus ainarchaeum sp.]MDD4662298.1 GtrA family protein [Candidatus ainarchaeum sp.]